MSKRLLWHWCVLPLGLIAFMGGSAFYHHRVPANETAAKLVVLYNSDQMGYLTPCGCFKPMMGGIPRRADYIKKLPNDGFLVKVENGNLTKAEGEQDRFKADTLMDMYNAMGYDAINLGEKDFLLGITDLQNLKTKFKGAFLCANVQSADGNPLFKEYALVDKELGNERVKVMIAGVLSEKSADKIKAKNPDLRVEPAMDALARLMPQIGSQGDVRVLLFQGSLEEAEAIAKKYPQFQMIVYAGQHDPVEMKTIGETALVCNGSDGKYVGYASFSSTGTWRLGVVKTIALLPLDKDNPGGYQDDPDMLQIKYAYLERVAAEDLIGKLPRRPVENGAMFMGSDVCGGCHRSAYQVWKSSKHNQAMETLVNDRHDRDPECVICHVVGMDRVSGFQSRDKTPMLEDVGCENCHGAGSKHVTNPTEVKMYVGGESVCMQCHVPEHSPKFDFTKYWEAIKHGKDQ